MTFTRDTLKAPVDWNTRVCPKPTHMIGGYAQLAWGFNYYGTVGSNRDEFIMIRKMKNVNWLDDEGRDQVQEAKK
ncbi:TPA: respiratory nitrate reductase subunit alpha [Escherichia coli]|nr:respiratory nitrate reductase subunit alpha [Escherichia coli]